jgi:hypothetical protein
MLVELYIYYNIVVLYLNYQNKIFEFNNNVNILWMQTKLCNAKCDNITTILNSLY